MRRHNVQGSVLSIKISFPQVQWNMTCTVLKQDGHLSLKNVLWGVTLTEALASLEVASQDESPLLQMGREAEG